MTDSPQQVTASLTAQNTGTDWLELRGAHSFFDISVQGINGHTVHLQRKRRNEAWAWLASMSPDAPTPIADAPGAGPSGEQSEFDFGGGC